MWLKRRPAQAAIKSGFDPATSPPWSTGLVTAGELDARESGSTVDNGGLLRGGNAVRPQRPQVGQTHSDGACLPRPSPERRHRADPPNPGTLVPVTGQI